MQLGSRSREAQEMPLALSSLYKSVPINWHPHKHSYKGQKKIDNYQLFAWKGDIKRILRNLRFSFNDIDTGQARVETLCSLYFEY